MDDELKVDWIPFDAFSNIKFLARGGFATVFTAELKESWYSFGDELQKVVLKKIGKRIPSEIVNEVCLLCVDG